VRFSRRSLGLSILGTQAKDYRKIENQPWELNTPVKGIHYVQNYAVMYGIGKHIHTTGRYEYKQAFSISI
jgi:hypothetical protein